MYQAIVRDLDRYENECMPDATVSSSNVTFDDVRYLEPQKTSFTIKNIKQVNITCFFYFSKVMWTIRGMADNFFFFQNFYLSFFLKKKTSSPLNIGSNQSYRMNDSVNHGYG